MTGFSYRLFLLTSLVMASLASPAWAPTWFIAADGSGDAPTIQAGVDAASPGDIVLVGPGQFIDTHPVLVDGVTRNVNVHVTKDIVLTSRDGASTTKLVGAASDIVILAEGLGATAVINGFEIEMADVGGWGCVDGPLSAGVSTSAAWQYGVRCQSSSCLISGNVIHGGNYAVYLSLSPAVVSDNDIDHSDYGVWNQGGDAFITNNRIFQCAALILSDAASPRIVANVLHGDAHAFQPCDGISVGGGSPRSAFTPFIADNDIEYISERAIFIGGATATIEGNRIRNGRSVMLYYAGPCVIRANVMTGTRLTALAEPLTIEGNTIVGGGITGVTGTLTRNLVVGGGIDCLGAVLSCNNSWGAQTNYGFTCANVLGQDGNISADPQFCGVTGSGNYYLQADSPCAPGHHPDGADCGTIGAFGVMCGTVKAKAVTWGSVKALYQ
jgi:Right handed beta helix region